MNVLFINHPEADYGGAFLFNGLCQYFGDKNVYDIPLKHSYHGIVHHYNTPQIHSGVTAPLPWTPTRDYAWQLPEAELLEQARALLRAGFFSLVVVESNRYFARRTFLDLKPEIAAAGIPVVVHDGEDYTAMNLKFLTETRAAVYLKRECQKGSQQPIKIADTHVLAFPFSSPIQPTSDVPNATHFDQRRYDVAMLFGATNIIRDQLVNTFREHYRGNLYAAINSEQDAPQGLQAWPNYVATMQDAKLVVAAAGYGEDTVRYWEAPAFSAMLTQDVNLLIPNPFVHGETCLMFNTPMEAVALAQSTPVERLQEIYENGWYHLMAYHTNRARIKYLMEYMSEEGLITCA